MFQQKHVGNLFPYALSEKLILKVSNGPSKVNILQGLHECGLITGIDLRMYAGVSQVSKRVEKKR